MDDFNYYNINSQPQEPQPVPEPPKRSSGFSTAALVMGICSFVLLCCGAGTIFGALGIIFALLSRRSRTMDGTAKVGLGLSIAGTIVSLIVYIVYFTYIIQSPEFRSIMQNYDYYYNNDGYYDDYYDDYDDYYDNNSINDLLDRYYNGEQDIGGDKTL